ncbi:MAG: NYN domain-containing protein [Chitinophagaceae bacterium]|nr:NYN domain-containing protein [Chitinophagaceae bacterium]
MEKTKKLALLVDGDNAQPKILDLILEEASKYGKVTIRRIYGDWTTPQMNKWKNILNDIAFNPIQKFSYTSGKNSTDSALIIDAMDILHAGQVDGFCIVSSDSDYTGLAKRIREEGVFVMGIGEKKTPNAFVRSCEIFTYVENLEITETPEEPEIVLVGKPAKEIIEKVKKPGLDIKLLNKAFDMSSNESDEVNVSTIGSNLRKLDPSFDPRTYGYKSLTHLLKNLKNFEMIDNIINGLNYHMIKRKA